MKRIDEIFTDRVRGKLYRFAASILGNYDDAEDAVHDVLEKFWRRKGTMENIGNVESFALISVRNTCIDKIRRRHETTDEIPECESPERSDAWNEMEVVRRAMARLPEMQRTIMHLRDIEGYSGRETSQITGIGEDQVRVYLSRARKALRIIIEKENNEIRH